MKITVVFYSYFQDLAGCPHTTAELPEGTRVGDLLTWIFQHYPRLAPLEKSMMVAVGLEYQGRDYLLKSGEEVALFPPVQGG